MAIVISVPFDWQLRLARGETDPDEGRYRMWKADVVRGPDDETVQGWYSRTYNLQEPATCAVYRADLRASAAFAWVLVAGPGEVPIPVIENRAFEGAKFTCRLHVGGVRRDVEMDASDASGPVVTTREEDEDGVG